MNKKIQNNIVCGKNTWSCKNGKCAQSIIDDSAITCDEIIESIKNVSTKSSSTRRTLTKTVPTKSNSANLYFTHLYLIGMVLLRASRIYCYNTEHWSKQKNLLLYHDTSNTLKEINNNNMI